MTVTTELANQLESSELGALVELYIIEYLDIFIYLTPSEGGFTFDGNTYVQFPIEIEGIERSQMGASNRPTVTVANIRSLFSDDFKEDIIGGRLTRILTFEEYENTDTSLPRQVFVIDRILEETFVSIQIELASPYDLHKTTLPRRRIVGGQCPWIYKGVTASTTRSGLIASSGPVGGCSWPADNKVPGPTGSVATVYMNKRDEYILEEAAVSASATAFTNDGTLLVVTIEEYYTTDISLYKVDSTGKRETSPTTKTLYWQAIRNQSFPFEEPSFKSNRWRAVKTYTRYDPLVTYSAYSDPMYNDYAIMPFIRNAGAYAPNLNTNIPINSDKCETILLPTGGVAYYFELGDLFEKDSSGNYITDPIIDLKASGIIVEVSFSPNLSSNSVHHAPGSTSYSSFKQLSPVTGYDPNKALAGYGIAEGQYAFDSIGGEPYLVIGHSGVTDGTALYNSSGNETSYGTGLNDISVFTHQSTLDFPSKLFKVRKQTLDPSVLVQSQHSPIDNTTGVRSPYWEEGDKCSKTLAGCSGRFNAMKKDIDYSTFSSSAGNTGFIPFPSIFKSSSFNKYNINDGTGVSGTTTHQLKMEVSKLETLGIPKEGICAMDFHFDGQYRTTYPYAGNGVDDCARISAALPANTPIFNYGTGGITGSNIYIHAPNNYARLFTTESKRRGYVQMYPLYYYVILYSTPGSTDPRINGRVPTWAYSYWTIEGMLGVSIGAGEYLTTTSSSLGAGHGPDQWKVSGISESYSAVGNSYQGKAVMLISPITNLPTIGQVDPAGDFFRETSIDGDGWSPKVSIAGGVPSGDQYSEIKFSVPGDETSKTVSYSGMQPTASKNDEGQLRINFLSADNLDLIALDQYSAHSLPFGGFPGSRKFK